MYKDKMKILMTLLVITSCTVKESREGSPCWLYETSSQMPHCTYGVWQAGAVLHDAVIASAGDYEFEIPRGTAQVVAVAETPRMSYQHSSATFTIVNGEPMDSIYTYRCEVDCSGEYATDTLIPRKQFATFRLTFDITPGHELYPDSLLLKSQWCGENALTLEPVAGTYECDYPCDSVTLNFRVPRQGDGTLSLVLYQKWGKVTDIVPIGQVLAENKYDWTAEELADVDMTLLQAAIGLKLVIVGWKDIEKPIIIDL